MQWVQTIWQQHGPMFHYFESFITHFKEVFDWAVDLLPSEWPVGKSTHYPFQNKKTMEEYIEEA